MSTNNFGTTSKKLLTIESVVPLSETDQKQVVENLGVATSDVEIKNVQNQALIAGIRVIYSGKVVDLSFQHALHEL